MQLSILRANHPFQPIVSCPGVNPPSNVSAHPDVPLSRKLFHVLALTTTTTTHGYHLANGSIVLVTAVVLHSNRPLAFLPTTFYIFPSAPSTVYDAAHLLHCVIESLLAIDV